MKERCFVISAPLRQIIAMHLSFPKTTGANHMLIISWKFRRVAFVLLGVLAVPVLAFAQPAPQTPMAEESPLLVEPAGPEEAFEAADLMQRIGRPNLAKRYIQQLLSANPDEATLLKLRDKHGPAIFMRMDRDPDLRPESRSLFNKVNAAFNKRGADPQRVNAMINDLSAGPRNRAVALDALRNAGAVVVPQILRRLATADNNEKSALISALVKMGRPVIPPLLGAVESPNQTVRGAAIEVLGYIGSNREVPYLWGPAFRPNENANVQQTARTALTKLLKPDRRRVFQVSSFGAPTKLKRAALEHYRNEYNWDLKPGETTVTLWIWDPQSQTVVPAKMTPEDASLYRGGQLARDALALSPENEDLQALFLGFALANALTRVGWNAPLPTGPNTALQLALSSGAELASRTLDLALENKNVPSAVATLQVLGQIASRNQLYNHNRTSPILKALNYPNQRVQFAAAVTVLQLDPDRNFTGTKRVVQILTRALGNSGGPAVLVIDPNPSRANNMAGLFQQIGYRGQPITKQTGQTGFQAAVNRNDVELIAVQANVTNWTLTQTLTNFRADSRTAHLPIVIYGPDFAAENVEKLIPRFPGTTFVKESITLDFFKMQVDPFLANLEAEPLNEEERAAQASAAAYWLAHLAGIRRTHLFDLASAEPALSEAIENPELAANAMQALGAIPSKTAQHRLQSVAVANVYDVRIRELAAIQLAFHVQRHGLLLTGDQVRAVQAAIPTAGDPQLASALASVLGSLNPSPQAIGIKLQQFPIPSPLAQ